MRRLGTRDSRLWRVERNPQLAGKPEEEEFAL